MILTHASNSGILERWLRRFAALLFGAIVAGLLSAPAQAVPSYARQTGSDCAACHVGGYGPQLTPYGIRFKIGGYTDSDGKDGKIPLSAMVVANWTRSAGNLPETPNHFSSNNNSAMQEASLFVAGRLTDNIGTFIQTTYSGVDRKSALDQVDIRYARNLRLGDQEGTVGLSLNGNPTLTDPFNTLVNGAFPTRHPILVLARARRRWLKILPVAFLAPMPTLFGRTIFTPKWGSMGRSPTALPI